MAKKSVIPLPSMPTKESLVASKVIEFMDKVKEYTFAVGKKAPRGYTEAVPMKVELETLKDKDREAVHAIYEIEAPLYEALMAKTELEIKAIKPAKLITAMVVGDIGTALEPAIQLSKNPKCCCLPFLGDNTSYFIKEAGYAGQVTLAVDHALTTSLAEDRAATRLVGEVSAKLASDWASALPTAPTGVVR
jgi:hypothetical protein